MKKLVLFIIPLFGLFFTSNSFALQHDYDTIMNVDYLFIPPLIRDSNNLLYRDFSSSDFTQSYSYSNLSLSFPSSFNAQFYPYSNQSSYYLMNSDFDQMSYSDGKCNILRSDGSPLQYFIHSTWVRSTGTSSGNPYNRVVFYGRPLFVGGGYNPDHSSSLNLSGDIFKCYTKNHAPYNYVDASNLHYYFHVIPYNNDVRNEFLNPLPDNKVQSYNGISLSQSQVHQSNGVTYNTSFSFSRLFDGPDNYIPYVRSLSIPLQTSDGYFQKYQNLTSGRQFEWHFSFQFTDTFERPEDMSRTYARIRLYGLPRSSQRLDNYQESFFNCTETVTQSMLDDETRYSVDYSCPVTLDTDYSDFMSVQFQIGNENDDFVFHTTKSWDFYSAYLVTDNDYTSGYSFNTDLDGDIWGPNNGDPTGESDISWFDSFINLFNFNVPSSPLGFLFSSFINPDTCAQIPTIASMIHSEETQVCPWFPAETRAITTPVLTLFSGFLLFGFIMHWLGSSSGNFIEDSSDGYTFTVGKHIGSVRSKK